MVSAVLLTVLIGINGLILVGIIQKLTELRLEKQARKESVQLAYSKNWRNR